MNSSTYKINNNSDLKFFLIQQWFTISTGSSPKLSTNTSVSPEMEILTITFRIISNYKLGQLKTNVNRNHHSGCTHIHSDQVKHP